jgi:serine protease
MTMTLLSAKRLFIPALVGWVLIACSSPPANPDPTEPLSFVVDSQVTPALAEVEGLEAGDPPRPTAGVESPSGEQMDFVLGELIVSAASEAALQPFLTRWNAEIVDVFMPDSLSDPDDPIEFLVRLNPVGADVSRLPDDLLTLEPDQQGEYRFSQQAALELLAIAIHEVAEYGLEASLNEITYSESFPVEKTSEAPGPNTNAFLWPYMNVGSAQNIGVGAAWQLMTEEGKVPPEMFADTIPILIHDGGFIRNQDFPSLPSIHRTKWGDENRMGCSGGNPCPWHGTHVAMAAMALADNQFGAAGPAGPVARLIAVGAHPDRWKRLTQLRKVVEQERPLIVNMSYGTNISFDKNGVRRRHNRHYKAMRKSGALLIASAGNAGRNVDTGGLILPCESTYVICVGGMGWNSTVLAETFGDTGALIGGSNYGTNVGKPMTESVELYGPYQVYSINDPTDPEKNELRRVSGTSYSSPFVAGVAALVWYANPELTASQVRTILRMTAHNGGLGSKVTGHQYRINAFGAVAHALGYEAWSEPTITIQAPTSVPLGQEVWLEADAKDHRGKSVPKVSWSIAGDVLETPPSFDGSHLLITDSLPVGNHTITATATDLGGFQATARVTIEVIYSPPEVFIFTPKVSSLIWANEPLSLSGTALSRNTPLLDNQVGWRVIAGNTTVHSAIGRTTVVPANKLPAGAYRIELTATDDIEMTTRSLNINLTPKPPSFPTATIISPVSGSKHVVPSVGPGATISFSGAATDPEDGNLSGTYFRWTAEHAGGVIVLCEGNNFLGQAAPVKDCSSFTATLPVQQVGAGGVTFETDYTITLQVKDTSGNPDEAVVGITVIIPPAP